MIRNRMPANSYSIATYAEFADDIKAFAAGKINFLIVIGTAGLGKTQTVREALGPNRVDVTGCPTAWGFYTSLADNPDAFVVMDDVSPKFFKSHQTQSYLKALTDTTECKTLHWLSGATGEDKSYPSEFKTSSRVIILCNDWDSVGEHVRAIESRAQIMIFKPSPAEVHHEVWRGDWFHDQEVFDFVWSFVLTNVITRPDMRLYGKLEEQKKAARPWRKRGIEMLYSDANLAAVAKLLLDPKYTSNNQRMQAFVSAGYGGRSHFYELLAEFRQYAPADTAEPPPPLAERRRPKRK